MFHRSVDRTSEVGALLPNTYLPRENNRYTLILLPLVCGHDVQQSVRLVSLFASTLISGGQINCSINCSRVCFRASVSRIQYVSSLFPQIRCGVRQVSDVAEGYRKRQTVRRATRNFCCLPASVARHYHSLYVQEKAALGVVGFAILLQSVLLSSVRLFIACQMKSRDRW